MPDVVELAAENCGNPDCWCAPGDPAAGWYWGDTINGWNGPFDTAEAATRDMEVTHGT